MNLQVRPKTIVSDIFFKNWWFKIIDKKKGDLVVQVKLTDLQADPSSPLYSAKTFEQLGLYVYMHTKRERKYLKNTKLFL